MLIFRKSWRSLFSCYFRSKFLITEEFSFNPGSALSSLPSHDAWNVSNTLKMTFLNCFLSEQVSTTVFFLITQNKHVWQLLPKEEDYQFWTYAKFFQKLIFLTLWCAWFCIFTKWMTKGLHRTFSILISKDRLISFYLTENQDKQT